MLGLGHGQVSCNFINFISFDFISRSFHDTGFVQAQHNVCEYVTHPITQTPIEDPYEGSVHRYDNVLNTSITFNKYRDKETSMVKTGFTHNFVLSKFVCEDKFGEDVSCFTK